VCVCVFPLLVLFVDIFQLQEGAEGWNECSLFKMAVAAVFGSIFSSQASHPHGDVTLINSVCPHEIIRETNS
jgi:hypothetical protein